MAGPALGGVLIGVVGAGTAFALDAASLRRLRGRAAARCARRARAAAAARAARVRRRPARRAGASSAAHAWLWATFASAAIAYLLFMGPVEVLLPYIVKHDLGGSAADLGLVFAAGGLGSVGCARRRSASAGCRAATSPSCTSPGRSRRSRSPATGSPPRSGSSCSPALAFNALETAGTIVWATAKQRHVPAALLGRVSSLDWLISIGLLPLSFALTGPVSGALGARTTLIAAGVLGAVVTFGALLLPGMRDVEGRQKSARPTSTSTTIAATTATTSRSSPGTPPPRIAAGSEHGAEQRM